MAKLPVKLSFRSDRKEGLIRAWMIPTEMDVPEAGAAGVTPIATMALGLADQVNLHDKN